MTSRRGQTGSVAAGLRGGLALRPILWNGWRGTLVGVAVGLGLVVVATWLLSTRDAHYDRPGVPALVAAATAANGRGLPDDVALLTVTVV